MQTAESSYFLKVLARDRFLNFTRCFILAAAPLSFHVFVSVAKTFHSFAISAAKVPSVSALEFRCCRVIPLRNQKRTFDERISCITRHNDFSPRSHRAVSLQVAPFPRECKNRGSRNEYFVCIDFHTSLGFATI